MTIKQLFMSDATRSNIEMGNVGVIGPAFINKKLIRQFLDLELKPTQVGINLKEPEKLHGLWQQFMSEYYVLIVPYLVDEQIFSIEEHLDCRRVRKWAAAEVHSTDFLCPEDLSFFDVNGKYFGFIHCGRADQFNESLIKANAYLQESGVVIDSDQARLEIMPKGYLPNDSLGNEQFWVPIT